MKTLYNILGFLALGMAVNAQSVQENSNKPTFNTMYWEAPLPDTQDETGLVFVGAFDNGSVSSIKQADVNVIEIKSYPNPTSDRLIVEITGLSEDVKVDFVIYNINGQETGNWELVESFSNENSYQLNVSNLAAGTYILQLKNNSINLNQTKRIEKF